MLEVPFVGKFLSFTTECNDHSDDIVDRLHRKITVVALILCAMFVGAKQQFGHPIQCMLPAHLDRSSWTAYGQYYCFVEGTYRLTYNKTIPNEGTRAKFRADVSINYYQWVPFFLVIQASCFFLPGWLWSTLQGQKILDMKAVVGEAVSLKTTFKIEDRTKKLKNLADYVAAALKLRMSTNVRKTKWCLFDRVNGISTVIYLALKLLTTVNDLLQLHIIARFIGFDGLSWAVNPLAVGKRYVETPFASPYFPLVTFCDMEQQTLNNVHTHTLQCVLMLNFINEKIFFMLWNWIFLLFVVSLGNFVITFVKSVQPRCRETLIKFYLQSGELDDEDCFLLTDKRRLRIYIHEFLGLDGALLLRFIDDHVGAIVARDMTVGLWHCFCCSYQNTNLYMLGEAAAADKESKIARTYSPAPPAVTSVSTVGSSS